MLLSPHKSNEIEQYILSDAELTQSAVLGSGVAEQLTPTIGFYAPVWTATPTSINEPTRSPLYVSPVAPATSTDTGLIAAPYTYEEIVITADAIFASMTPPVLPTVSPKDKEATLWMGDMSLCPSYLICVPVYDGK